VADIEHNIIAPNIVYKLYLKNLEAAVTRNIEVERSLVDLCAREVKDTAAVESVMSELSDVNRTLKSELLAIGKHHQNMSLFLEALLRRSHFDQGRLTLRTKKCNMKREVLEPQLERYAERFRNLGIVVDNRLSGIPDEETVSVVDVGLMAQVYANLFSNALKYTREITTHSGEIKKYVSYGYERIRDYFGAGTDGLKYNLFSTGQHIEPGERDRVFEDEFRGTNSRDKPGTGHGLAFIKNVVEIHGGIVGYEPTEYGNNFYFILPGKD
jgi:signal transduction histidine kinase